MRHEHAAYRRPAWAGVALALALTVFQPAAPAGAEAVFTFEGGGYGHSVGMSQFGAYGMALDGYGWQEILTHYYTGTTVEQADPRFTDPPLWVGIVQEYERVEFLVRAIGEDPVPVTVTRNTKTLTAQPGETIVIEHLGDDRCRVTTPAGSLTGGCGMVLEWDGWEESPATALQLQGCTLPDWNAPGGTVYKPCTYARGAMHVNPDNNTQTVDVSLEIDVEDYVLGISESPYFWGDRGGMAALQAQAVAARSYAIHRSVDRGDPASRPWCWCQIYDTPVDQNYVGWGHGTQTWIDAVQSTAGMVVTHPSETRDGALLPIEAFYSSSTFGWTENSEHGFTAYVPYLRNVPDPWSLDYRVYNHSGRWTREFSASSLAARLPGMSTVTGLEVTGCSPSGAALEITFTGSGGPRSFTTRELRGHLGLRSMQIIRAGSPLPDEPACPQPGDDGGGGEPSEPGPVVLSGLSLDDDSSGDSSGNGNGTAECGEVVEVYTTITNQGAPIDGVSATLYSDDPYVSIRWNTTSTFPDLDTGASAANDGDWDLTIAPGTPDGHTATLTMTVAADGHQWTVPVEITVTCGGSNEPAERTDPPTCAGEPATIWGTDGDDVIEGTSGRDVIAGLGGDDVIDGGGDDDLICGGAGNDVIRGGSGDDVIRGEGGNDVIRGNRGNDVIRGNRGRDRLHGDIGRDRLYGGGGRDLLVGGSGADRLAGGAGPDTLKGRKHDDVLLGQRGDDRLRGNRGDDRLDGGNGDDWGHGGAGTDTCTAEEAVECES